MDIIGVGLGVVFEEFDEAICKEYDVRRLKTHCKLILLYVFMFENILLSYKLPASKRKLIKNHDTWKDIVAASLTIF